MTFRISILAGALIFGAGCASSSPDPAQGTQGAGNIAERIMQRYDLDRDGRITSEEADTARAQRFARMDVNGDGLLTSEEAEQIRQEAAANGRGGRMGQRRGGGDPFARLDTDGDGAISAVEFEASDGQLLGRADLNGDGVVERSELESLVEQFRARRAG